MEHFSFEWDDRVHIHRITPRWVMKLAIWSVIVAYLPNIIWYFAGYPANVIFMQMLVITIGMPIVIFLAMKAYRRYYAEMPLHGYMKFKGTDIMIYRTILSETFHYYIELWKSGIPLIESITLNRDKGEMAVRALLHVEAYTRKKDGSIGALVATDSITRTIDVKVPEDKMDELMDVLNTYYSDVLIIKNDRKGDTADGKKI